MATDAKVRSAQLITTYGVGSIVASGDQSLMVCGIDRWPVSEPDLHEPRLERQLQVNGFAKPPAGDGAGTIPVVKFPRWQSCPNCERLAHYRDFGGVFDNRCQECDVALVPSRFVVACPKGHIEDFPYFAWIHARGTKRGPEHQMTLSSNAGTASLASIVIRCSCGAWATMEDAFNRHVLRESVKCQGQRPWLPSNDEACGEALRTLQRGASNVWFADTRSAISIPPWSEGAYRALNKHWSLLRGVSDRAALEGIIDGSGLAEKSSFTVNDLVDAVHRRQAEEAGEKQDSAELRREEYDALIRGRPEEDANQEFVAVVGEISEDLRPHFEQVTLVKRLREVRALVGFRRLTALKDPKTEPSPISAVDTEWLPAIDVQGEGVFLRFNESKLEGWEKQKAVVARAATLNERFQRVREFLGAEEGTVITPRFILIHTFAHALINQWALEAGYPAAALRERLYSGTEMAGLLIYTATTDSAGSLGGVVAQAAPERLSSSIRDAVRRFKWCSADPVCAETYAAGADSLNMAACHACSLLPETSCEERNTLLDRRLLVGDVDGDRTGFFDPTT